MPTPGDIDLYVAKAREAFPFAATWTYEAYNIDSLMQGGRAPMALVVFSSGGEAPIYAVAIVTRHDDHFSVRGLNDCGPIDHFELKEHPRIYDGRLIIQTKYQDYIISLSSPGIDL